MFSPIQSKSYWALSNFGRTITRDDDNLGFEILHISPFLRLKEYKSYRTVPYILIPAQDRHSSTPFYRRDLTNVMLILVACLELVSLLY